MLIQISEEANKVSPSFINEHTEIPWQLIKGLRNRIVHDYGSTDFEIIYGTCINDIIYLKEILTKIM